MSSQQIIDVEIVPHTDQLATAVVGEVVDIDTGLVPYIAEREKLERMVRTFGASGRPCGCAQASAVNPAGEDRSSAPWTCWTPSLGMWRTTVADARGAGRSIQS